jgi:DNA repair protein RecO (recombination protein O)
VEWRDEGLLLAVRRHGESAAIVEVFTEGHGRHAGVVRGGASRRMAPLLQPGAQVAVEWSARLEDHIGTFRVDVVRSRSAEIMGDGAALAALGSVAALVSAALPERAAHRELYGETLALVEALAGEADWPRRYAGWELKLLAELGFGLDLGACAVTGRREGLVFVSPRSGRAVSREGAGEWAARLLPLPAFLRDPGAAAGVEDVRQALDLAGYFLEARLGPTLPKGLPPARGRAVAAIVGRRGG